MHNQSLHPTVAAVDASSTAAELNIVMPPKVRKMKLGWSACSLVMCIGLISCGPKTENSAGKNKSGFEDFLSAHLVAVVPIPGKVSFVSDGGLGVRDNVGAWQKEFTLGAGEKFMSQPDHHASSSFEVVNIKPRGVDLKYVSKFDHRSFGKNLVTTDEGTIEIPFRNKK
jgi:hypothetical protein